MSEKLPLPWTKCWRKIYHEEAKALGYGCRWGSGDLIILNAKGAPIFRTQPKSNPFFMATIIELIEEQKQAWLKERAEAKKQEQEAIEEKLARISGGEPLLLLRVAQREEEREVKDFIANFSAYSKHAFAR